MTKKCSTCKHNINYANRQDCKDCLHNNYSRYEPNDQTIIIRRTFYDELTRDYIHLGTIKGAAYAIESMGSTDYKFWLTELLQIIKGSKNENV
jgi:hypothetical protein